jgi:hypothetical protein
MAAFMPLIELKYMSGSIYVDLLKTASTRDSSFFVVVNDMTTGNTPTEEEWIPLCVKLHLYTGTSSD